MPRTLRSLLDLVSEEELARLGVWGEGVSVTLCFTRKNDDIDFQCIPGDSRGSDVMYAIIEQQGILWSLARGTTRLVINSRQEPRIYIQNEEVFVEESRFARDFWRLNKNKGLQLRRMVQRLQYERELFANAASMEDVCKTMDALLRAYIHVCRTTRIKMKGPASVNLRTHCPHCAYGIGDSQLPRVLVSSSVRCTEMAFYPAWLEIEHLARITLINDRFKSIAAEILWRPQQFDAFIHRPLMVWPGNQQVCN